MLMEETPPRRSAQGLNRPHFDLMLPQALPQGRFCTLLSTPQKDENPAICRVFVE